jgi:prepilin peptidase CpaA
MVEPTFALNLLHAGLVAAAVALLFGASLNDVAVRTIPDLISLGIAAAGLALRLIEGTLLSGLAAAAALFVLAALCWRCGWLGGGDVKLLAACALLVRPTEVPEFVLTTALAGGALACAYLAIGRITTSWSIPTHAGRARSLGVRMLRAEGWRARRHFALPYGCAIAAAVMFNLLMN